ncbi:MAG: hypothetical protein GX915_02735 [Clostridiales bacterium]|nr:hypothetical protein [Clostridiales bacterium]
MGELNYKNLPIIDKLKEILVSQAALDIIMIEDKNRWFRLINFYKNISNGIDIVKIDNGLGDHVYIVFADEGAIIKGYAHESIMSPYANDEVRIAEGIYDYVPSELMILLDDSEEFQDVTFCVWRKQNDMFWSKGDIIVPNDYKDGDDGEYYLLKHILQDAGSWLEWAKTYYEERAEKIDLEDVKRVYEQQNITKDILMSINPDSDFEEVCRELKRIGYNSGVSVNL